MRHLLYANEAHPMAFEGRGGYLHASCRRIGQNAGSLLVFLVETFDRVSLRRACGLCVACAPTCPVNRICRWIVRQGGRSAGICLPVQGKPCDFEVRFHWSGHGDGQMGGRPVILVCDQQDCVICQCQLTALALQGFVARFCAFQHQVGPADVLAHLLRCVL